MHHLPHSSSLNVVGGSPTSTKIDYSSRQNPRQPKLTEESIPNGTSNLTMKKTVHKLSIPFAHKTPINHNDASLPKIIHVKDLS
jgi:hypothetical protein